MEIRFLGLIVHTRLFDDGTQVAVLLQHDTHKPTLTVPEGSLNVAETTAPYTHENGVYCFRLGGHVTSSVGVGASKTSGIDELPRIEHMRTGGGEIHPSIIRREDHPNFHALFEIPRGGELSAEDYFVYEGVHRWNIGCVPRTILYSRETTGDVEFTFRHKEHKQVVIHGDAKVYVTNRCHCKNEGDSDQAAYAKFFSPTADSITAVTTGASPKKCTKGKPEKPIRTCAGTLTIKSDDIERVTFENIDVDCTSSRYP